MRSRSKPHARRRLNKRSRLRRLTHFRQRVSKPFFILVMLLVFAVILGASVNYIVNSSFLRVANINISGTHSVVNRTDLHNFVFLEAHGDRIFDVDSDRISALILQRFLGVREVIIQKKYPTTLNIIVGERAPLAIFHSKHQESYFLSDTEGFIFGLVDAATTNLPVVEYNHSLDVGQHLSGEDVEIYTLLINSIDEYSLDVSEIYSSKTTIELKLNSQVLLVFPRDQEIAKNAYTAALLLKQLENSGQVPTKIDLRFDKVVVQ
jgi:cell division septal protein FtsQ